MDIDRKSKINIEAFHWEERMSMQNMGGNEYSCVREDG